MKPTDYQSLQQSSYLSGGNAAYIEELYEDYLVDPDSIDTAWKSYFDTLQTGDGKDVSHADIRAQFAALAQHPHVAAIGGDALLERKQSQVAHLVVAYRTHGHLRADTNPLPHDECPAPQLELSYHGLSDADLDTEFVAEALMQGQPATLKEILDTLKKTYTQSIGAEYMHIRDQEEVEWIQNRLESVRATPNYTKEEKHTIMQMLTAADGMEKYLGNRYVGQKRFSLEGGDALIPMMHFLNHRAGEAGVKEINFGMAHRGRLNMLINIMGKDPSELFAEFEGTREIGLTSGDVKYHIGYSSDIETKGGPLHLTMAFNPSHLEVISPVVNGSARARIHRRRCEARDVMSVVLHGDAAVAGQGIVMETLNMSQTRGFCVGGTVHVVINNQVGFTISSTLDSRSSLYCTDIAKMVDSPVLHVNGDDPEACVFAAQLATDYRMKFGKDIFIDLICYRRHGHNEADEPAATQPLMYKDIRSHQAPRLVYAERLQKEGVLTSADTDKMFDEYKTLLDEGKSPVTLLQNGLSEKHQVHWTPFLNQDWKEEAETGFDHQRMLDLAGKMVTLPNDFTCQRQVGHVMENRVKMAKGELPCDWGFAENLAYATLLDQDYSIRITGEDVRRGTFAHRHATLHDNKNGNEYMPLLHVTDTDATFEVYDSLLSEEAVVAYEYGYAKTDPNNLVIWEAQFGDFVNGAQIVIDQFISSAWQKWERLSGLVMLLPHGYEGMGPEHSSARLERFLQLCAQDNIQVCTPSTPAQIFHLLRRQMVRRYRRPLIVMSPKSLLRHKLAVSSLEELSGGHFQNVIPEIDEINPKKVKRVVMCGGKVYYDLLKKRREEKIDDVAIIRIEQLYPFPYDEFKEVIKPYAHVKDFVWCQEESKNQGAWFISHHRFVKCLAKDQTVRYVGRPASASPAVGYPKLHTQQQEKLVNEALSEERK